MSRRILAFVITLLISVVAVFLVAKLGYDAEYREMFDEISAFVDRWGMLSVAIFIAVYTAFVIFIFWLPVWSLAIVGGALFGFFWGSVYSLVSLVLGSLISYRLVSYIEGGFVMDRISIKTKWIEDMLHSMDDRGLSVVLSLRLLHFVPFRALNYTSGILPVSFRDFSIGTFLGIIPATLFYSYLGVSLVHLESDNLTVAAFFAVVFSAIIYLRYQGLLSRKGIEKVLKKGS